MTAIVASIEIARNPVDVFAYATDLSRYPEWQGGVGTARLRGAGPIRAGSRAVLTRRVGPRMVEYIEEVVELDPPWSWTVRSIGGLPVAAIAETVIQPLGRRQAVAGHDHARFRGSRARQAPASAGHPAAARKTLPEETRELKQILEGSHRNTGQATA